MPTSPARRPKRRTQSVTVTGLKALPIVLFAFTSLTVALVARLAVPALVITVLLILLGVVPSPF